MKYDIREQQNFQIIVSMKFVVVGLKNYLKNRGRIVGYQIDTYNFFLSHVSASRKLRTTCIFFKKIKIRSLFVIF